MQNSFFDTNKDAMLLLEMLVENPDFIDVVDLDVTFNKQPWFYKVLIQFLSGLDFPEPEAVRHFEAIKNNQKEIRLYLGRDVGIRVATFDYFSNRLSSYENPTVTEVKALNTLEKENRLDSKTGCFNSHFFKNAVNRELARCKRYGQNFSVMILDLDNFKATNDNYGHIVGDLVLKRFVSLLVSEVRSEDLVGRFGGDEFVVLMPHTDERGAKALGERIHARILKNFHGDDPQMRAVNFKYSGGVATFPYEGMTYDTLIASADRALYQAKINGKNMILGANDEMDFTETNGGSEKRRSPRMDVDGKDLLKLITEDPFLEITAQIVNISETGALMDCRAQLKPELVGSTVEIKSRGPWADGSKHIKAVIARNMNQIGQLQFNLGVCFLKKNNLNSIHLKEKNLELL